MPPYCENHQQHYQKVDGFRFVQCTQCFKEEAGREARRKQPHDPNKQTFAP